MIRPSNFQLMYLNASHIELVAGLQREVYASLPDKRSYTPLEDDKFQEYIHTPGTYLLGAFHQGNLVAFRFFTVRTLSEERIWQPYLPTHALHSQVGRLTRAIVSPFFRGHGLQHQMSRKCMHDVLESETLTHVFSLVAFDNYPSIVDKLKLGFAIIDSIRVYNDKERFVFYRNCAENANQEMNNVLWANSFQEQKQLLRSGFRGDTYAAQTGGFSIRFVS